MLRTYLERSVALLAEDYKKYARIYWETLPDYVKALAEGVYLYISRTALDSKAPFVVEYDVLREFIEMAAEGKYSRPRDIHSIIKRRISDLVRPDSYGRTLEEIGIAVTVDSGGKIKISVEPDVLLRFMNNVDLGDIG
ncbi:hypothetical protein [Pyrodictium abyssi]|uniref:Uncharacterized protein n=1 Tax=Pyrodictium abyssi TaxID=54256 RepID=A0ABN6ZTB4_9CREN|nr:hypothetical protein PABY_08430 [Pyrodictium abyssi]